MKDDPRMQRARQYAAEEDVKRQAKLLKLRASLKSHGITRLTAEPTTGGRRATRYASSDRSAVKARTLAVAESLYGVRGAKQRGYGRDV